MGHRLVKDRPVSHDGSGDPTSFNLLERVREDDRDAWRELVNLYGPLVYRWCRRFGLQQSDAADVGQEVFKAVVRSIGTYRHDRPGDTFRGWLHTITHRKLVDRHRLAGPVAEGGSDAHRRMANVPDDAAPADASSLWDDRRLLARQAIELVRAEVEPTTWEAFWRAAVERQPVDAVAADLGITANAVYVAKSRVRRRLTVEYGPLLALALGKPPADGKNTNGEG